MAQEEERCGRHHHGVEVRLADDEQAAKVLDEFGVPYEAEVVSAHRTPDKMVTYAEVCSRTWPAPDHCGCGRRGTSAGDGGVEDDAAGARRSGEESRRSRGSTHCSPLRRCPAEFLWRRLPSARLARRTQGCSPCRCLRLRMRGSRASSRSSECDRPNQCCRSRTHANERDIDHASGFSARGSWR